jgi:hypothetical protein
MGGSVADWKNQEKEKNCQERIKINILSRYLKREIR